jgi:cardiolipin synthase
MSGSFRGGNRVGLLRTGSEFFPALLAAIDGAVCEVHLETYIFADDATGRLVADALMRAAQRGVRVRLLVDGFGAHEFSSGMGRELVAQQVHLLVYRQEVAWLRFRRTRLRRLHRKLAVIDGRLAFVGGINIIDDLDTPGHIPPRFDYAVTVEGPLVQEIHAAVHHLWTLVRWATLRHRPHYRRTVLPISPPLGETQAAFLIRDNLRHRHDIEAAYLAAIDTARHEILLANAYFLPGRRFRAALCAAARRGCKVTVLLQGRVEYLLLHYATRALYDELLAAGVHIVEYHGGFLHAKVGVVDGTWATVGSSNIDPFSFLLAREANLVVRDAAFAETLNASLQEAMRQHGQAVKPHYGPRTWLGRLTARLAYGLVRLAIGISRYGGPEYRE